MRQVQQAVLPKPLEAGCACIRGSASQRGSAKAPRHRRRAGYPHGLIAQQPGDDQLQPTMPKDRHRRHRRVPAQVATLGYSPGKHSAFARSAGSRRWKRRSQTSVTAGSAAATTVRSRCRRRPARTSARTSRNRSPSARGATGQRERDQRVAQDEVANRGDDPELRRDRHAVAERLGDGSTETRVQARRMSRNPSLAQQSRRRDEEGSACPGSRHRA